MGGRGRLGVISGEPGIGKTRLAEEVARRASDWGATVIWGRGDDGGGAPPFWPWVQIVRSLCDKAEPAALSAALAPRAAELAQLVPEVRDAVGEIAPLPPTDPATARFRLYEATAGLLACLAGESALVVVLDDLHWADLPSLQLARFVAHRLDGTHVFLLATYRDLDPVPGDDLVDTLGALARVPGLVRVALGGLDQAEVAEFLARACDHPPDEQLAAAVWAGTDGNPFFVGELARLLAAEGTRVRPAGASFPVPPGIRDVIRRRLARLPEATKAVLDVAAVAGRDFSLPVVADAAGIDEEQTVDLLDSAMASGIVRENADSTGGYRFDHALTRDAIYGDVGGLRRCRLHAKIGDSIERQEGPRASAAALAHHFFEAASVVGEERGIAAAVLAAEQAQATLAYEAAEAHLRRALSLVERCPPGKARAKEELLVQHRLASLLSMVRGFADAASVASWTRCCQLATAIEHPHDVLRSLWGMFLLASVRADASGQTALTRQLRGLADATGDAGCHAAGLYAAGEPAFVAGELGLAEMHLRGAIAATEPLDDASLEASFFGLDPGTLSRALLSWALCLLGQIDSGRAMADDNVRLAEGSSNPFRLGAALTFAGTFGAISGDPALALRRSAESMAISERFGLHDLVLSARVPLEWATVVLGGESASVDELKATVAASLASGQEIMATVHLALLADALKRVGELEEGLATTHDALARSAATGAQYYDAELHRQRGELLAQCRPQRSGEADASFERALDVAERQGAVELRRRAQESRSRAPHGFTGPS